MKYKILKECVIDHTYFKEDDIFESNVKNLKPFPQYICELLSHGFMKPVYEDWSPSEGEIYWFICDDLTVDFSFYDGGYVDANRQKIGNCFSSKKKANAACVKIRPLIGAISNEQL